MAAALAEPASTGLRVRAKDGPLESLLARRGWTGQPLPWAPEGALLPAAPDLGEGRHPEGRHPATLHPWQDAGAYYLQDPAAMGVAPLLGVEPGERVLDLAAAPGGKSTYLADRLGRSGLLWCHDIDSRRAGALVGNLERWGAPNVVVSQGPVALLAPLAGSFDKVLLDAPCSGEGLFRKSSDARRLWSPRRVAEFAALQAELLDAAVALLRPGGLLVYSTCTFNDLENERQVAGLLNRRQELRPSAVAPAGAAPGLALTGLGDRLNDGLSAACARWWPHHQVGDGHFAARLQLQGDAGAGVSSTQRRGGKFGEEPTRTELAALAAFGEQTLGLSSPLTAAALSGMDGAIRSHQEQLWLVPAALLETGSLSAALSSLRAVPRRVGLPLGVARNGRFRPHHALSRVLPADGVAARRLELSEDDPRLAAYLRGESISAAVDDGWLLVRTEGLPLGWAKASRGELNNHFPRGLRRGPVGD